MFKNARTALVLSLVGALAACAQGTEPAKRSVTGTATYRERIALPPDVTFEAALEDVSRADAPAEILGRVQTKSPGQPPFEFSIPYDPAAIKPTSTYAVRARIVRGDELIFTTDTRHEVLSHGQPAHADILLRRVAATEPSASTASLENTYWKLMIVGGTAVTVGEGQREPYLVLQIPDRRVVGYGGCNRFSGGYSTGADRLTFGQVAATMMACLQGGDTESAFFEALEKAATWKITGERLELFDATGQSVAQFESRYMQ